MPTIRLRGGPHLAYRAEGAGPPLVLVHGSPGDGRAWTGVSSRLALRFHVLVPDLPGSGASDALAAPASDRTAALAAAVVELVDRMEGPVLLAGHSYGGNVALHVAVARPDRLSGLVLFEPVFFRALSLCGVAAMLEPARRHFAAYVADVEAAVPDAVAGMIDFWFGEGAFAKLPLRVQGYLHAAAPSNALDVQATFRETLEDDALRNILAPTTIVSGGASPPVVGGIAAALSTLLPNARRFMLHGANHAMLETHPDEVAAAIRSSIQEMNRASEVEAR